MILYNITFNVEEDVVRGWEEYFMNVHLPYLREQEMVMEARFLKLMTEIPEATGTTYTCQISIKGKEELESFFNEVESDLYSRLYERFSGKFVYFNSMLQEL